MGKTLFSLLQAAASRAPDRAALSLGKQTLSYAELELRSNQLAWGLRRRGLRPGERVAIWLPKSFDAVVALYGVMKAGGAYVPMDPEAPPARIGRMARDCQAQAVVCHRDSWEALHPALGSDFAPACWFMAEELFAEQSDPPDWHVEDTSLAYILYTSGSTGQPKGVAHTHASAFAFVEWSARTFMVGGEDRVASHAPFHFDLSTFDLFASAHGAATVCLVPQRIAFFPAALARWWEAERLSVVYATPSTLTLLLSRGGLSKVDLSPLRLLLFAGEVMPPSTLRALMGAAPRARYINLYGPTETNVCTAYEVERCPDEHAVIPIGRPCPGHHAFITLDGGKRAEPGEVGELWISGPTLMQGYWGHDDWTEERTRWFEGPEGKLRCYRTGDRVREGPGGQLYYVGRIDQQVKSRGYRIELGEIEHVLSQHPAVAEAMVAAVPDTQIGHRLHALVTVKPGMAAEEGGLRAHCAAALAAHMVPESILLADEVPRTSTGKADRQRISALFAAENPT